MDFFLLQDLVTEDFSAARFFIEARNRRIDATEAADEAPQAHLHP